MSGSQLYWIQAHSADLPALQCGYSSAAYSRRAPAALSTGWIRFSKCWVSGYPEQKAISQECWITSAEKLHQLHCPQLPQAVCKHAAGLPQLGRVGFTLHGSSSCAALDMILLDLPVLMGTAELCLAQGGSSIALTLAFLKHIFLFLCIYLDPWFTNLPFLCFGLSRQAGPAAKNIPSINTAKLSVSTPFLKDYLHSYLWCHTKS